MATITGGSGDDSLDGTENGDSISGAAGRDTLRGGAGNDTISGGIGRDSISGGTGADSIDGGADDDSISGGAGDDTIAGGSGDDTIAGGADDDHLDGGQGADSVSGGDGSDTIVSGGGRDTLSGGADDDTFVFTALDEDVLVSGGETTTTGTDFDTIDLRGLTAPVIVTYTGDEAGTIDDGFGHTITFSGIEKIILTDFGDFVDGRSDSAGMQIDGRGGSDSVMGGSGNDTIDGGDGNDMLIGGAGNDSLIGGAGDDEIGVGASTADTGTDTVYAGDGNDSVYGDAGADLIFGGAGDDRIEGRDGADTIDGGDGNDVIVGYDAVGLNTGDYAVATDDGSADSLSGGGGSDSIYGGGGNDTIDGGADNDDLRGGAGNDLVEGGAGNDTLEGGAGDDSLVGGDGDDVFVYAPGDGHDTIADFNFGNTGALRDGDTTNNDFVDLGAYYDSLGELRADQSDDGILNQSNATDDRGNATDYSDNTQFGSGSITMQGAEPTSYRTDNTGVVCFTAGTAILTPKGEVLIDDLRIDDMVCTLDNGPQPIAWIGRRHIDRAALCENDRLRPVLIREGALGARRDLLVSRQHGMLIDRDHLARATHLAGAAPGVRIAHGKREVSYIHLMFEAHQIIFAEGIPSESFYPGPMALRMMDLAAMVELTALFPDIRLCDQGEKTSRIYGRTARSFAKSQVLIQCLAGSAAAGTRSGLGVLRGP